MIDIITDLAEELISAIQSAINVLNIALENLDDYPNVLGDTWALLPSGMQMFAVALLIITCFVALMAAVIKR